MSGLIALLVLAGAPAPAWPLTASELEGQSASLNPRIEDTPPCKGKGPVELRLFARVKDGPQLRLTVKNCRGKAVRLLHERDLQPSRLDFKAKVKAPFDERSRRKFDNTVRLRSFVVLEPGQERLLADETFKREGEAYAMGWGPYRYEAIPLGRQAVRAVLDAWVDSAVDDESSKQVKVENAAVGSFKSNDVTLALP